MRLKSIELIGFKSFADRTVLDFHPGITAIVGPNGCGKSNIVDAFKWVLGEQSAKSLRGDSMEDVIFFGSATRKTRGMAEVTLVLSGIREGEEGDSEISVTRRLYRSGESEYLLNRTPCRLKDIKNVFLDTGLELKAYSILEQGRINDILDSKPQDRRFLIEEVAGVMKYKVRRAEATQKLESARYNLQRLQDIISEVKRQINSIDRYARKAERYKRLLQEVRDLEIRIAKRDIGRLTGEADSLSASIEQLKTKVTEATAEIHSLEALMEKKRSEYTDREKGLDEVRGQLHGVERMMTESEGVVALLRKESDNLREKVDALKRMHLDLINERQKAGEEIYNIKEEFTRLSSKLKETERLLKEKEVFLKKLIEEISGHEALIDNQRKSIFSKAEEGSILKNEVKHLSMTIDEIDRKIERLTGEIVSVEDSLSGIKDDYKRTEGEYQRLLSSLSDYEGKREEMAEMLKKKKDELRSEEDLLYRCREEVAGMASRYESLRELYASKKIALSGSIKTICQIADILETPPEYESAIEAVLGDKLNTLVVEGHEDIMMALRHVKEHNTKRCSFISLNPPVPSNHERSKISSIDIPVDDSIIKATDVIKVREGFQAVAMALLGDVVIVKDMSTAFKMREKVDKYLHIVTPEGEVFEPSGVVHGGIERGLLRIRRQMRELEGGIELKRQEISRRERTVSDLRDEIRGYEDKIVSVDQVISEVQGELREMRIRLDGLKDEDEQRQRKLHYLRTELQNEENEREGLKSLKEEKDRRHRELEVERAEAEKRLKSLQSDINNKKEMLENVRSEHTDIKLSMTSLNERIKTLKNEEERLLSLIGEIDTKKTKAEEERIAIEKEIRLKEEEIRKGQDVLRAHAIQARELQEDLKNATDSITGLADEIRILEERHRVLSSQLDKLKEELKQKELKRMELVMKMDYIREDIRKTHNVTIETVNEVIEVTPEDEERLPQLKEKLKDMGPVSLGTLEEYEELRTRYEFLTKQQDDILDSMATLEETIQRINSSTKRRLTEAFNALNEKFREVFRSLFGEGRAELILTEGDILESGIDIVAQPPGKRLKNLLALSGGEQALTALSLLFAGFMIKPTPMCVLDEVDAPLDESNTGRFVRLLAELSRDIQFIAITHNRLTMEVADYIYGVTMEEPGVSKVVSMHLAETV